LTGTTLTRLCFFAYFPAVLLMIKALLVEYPSMQIVLRETPFEFCPLPVKEGIRKSHFLTQKLGLPDHRSTSALTDVPLDCFNDCDSQSNCSCVFFSITVDITFDSVFFRTHLTYHSLLPLPLPHTFHPKHCSHLKSDSLGSKPRSTRRKPPIHLSKNRYGRMTV
jgi:hypothetical protein